MSTPKNPYSIRRDRRLFDPTAAKPKFQANVDRSTMKKPPSDTLIVNYRSNFNKSLREGSNTGGKLRRKTKKYHKKSKKRVRKCKKCRGTQKRR